AARKAAGRGRQGVAPDAGELSCTCGGFPLWFGGCRTHHASRWKRRKNALNQRVMRCSRQALGRDGRSRNHHGRMRQPVRYVSTRGEAPPYGFTDATLAGLARDGGLYVPETWPRFDAAAIAGFAGRPY